MDKFADAVISGVAFIFRILFGVITGLFWFIGYVGGALTNMVYGRPTNPAQKVQTLQPANQRESPVGMPLVGAAGTQNSSQATSVPRKIDAEVARAQQPNQRVAPAHGYGIAERVQTAELYTRGNIKLGVMWVYLYPDKSVARRVFKITDRALAFALKREVWYMEDVPYDPALGIQAIMDGMGKDCTKLLNRPTPPVVREKPVQKSKAPMPKPVTPSLAPVVMKSPPLQPVPPVAKPEPEPKPELIQPSVVMPNHSRAVKGQIYAGRVTTAGLTTKPGFHGRPDYQTFCLTINDGQVETPLFGTELQRQTADLKIKPGENVKVVFMGQESLPNGMSRNRYQVSRMEAS